MGLNFFLATIPLIYLLAGSLADPAEVLRIAVALLTLIPLFGFGVCYIFQPLVLGDLPPKLYISLVFGFAILPTVVAFTHAIAYFAFRLPIPAWVISILILFSYPIGLALGYWIHQGLILGQDLKTILSNITGNRQVKTIAKEALEKVYSRFDHQWKYAAIYLLLPWVLANTFLLIGYILLPLIFNDSQIWYLDALALFGILILYPTLFKNNHWIIRATHNRWMSFAIGLTAGSLLTHWIYGKMNFLISFSFFQQKPLIVLTLAFVGSLLTHLVFVWSYRRMRGMRDSRSNQLEMEGTFP